ncbi:MAG: formimidoylglutamate deiminase [Proteobacteria bacterium]|nr:formimidoylglutamate deiminase [Pseudomonadota bacterium]
MTTIFAQKALLPEGWADDVRLSVADGCIRSIVRNVRRGDDDILAECLIPGLCNSHSHAFQRALAGRTEERSPAGQDNFWTWRERMYELAASMNAERLQAIARQAYVEMLSSGYTSVAEFHYLHREPGSDSDDDRMFAAIRDAAKDSGIRLTYVPVLYERGGFDQLELSASQKLFALDLDCFLEHHARVSAQSTDRMSVGIGAHSIRAVSSASLAEIAAVAKSADCPMHLHIAEQQREVDQCLAHYERRPVRWLLENFDVDSNWCLVHATHMDAEEIEQLAATRAVVSLCPSTEANLGDGLFPLSAYLQHNGRIAIGSDSHVTLNPFEELRWLEYGQRLAAQSRNIASHRDSHVGRELFERAVEGGAAACGLKKSGITEGAVADLVTLYGEDPMLVGHDDASRLDALVFSGYQLPIESVMVAGEWLVMTGEHRAREDSRKAFADAVRNLGSSGERG